MDGWQAVSGAVVGVRALAAAGERCDRQLRPNPEAMRRALQTGHRRHEFFGQVDADGRMHAR
eukprot:6276952-Pyramimonas_sp.AAC.1